MYRDLHCCLGICYMMQPVDKCYLCDAGNTVGQGLTVPASPVHTIHIQCVGSPLLPQLV